MTRRSLEMTEAVATVAGRLPAVSVTGLGNTGLSGAGMTLGSFLDARGSLIYGAHPNADPTRGAGHTLDVRVFVESMMPFVVYREFGTGFESPDDQGIAFEEWLQEHVVVVGDYPSGYLLSLMWVLLAPPVEFQRVVLERELIDNGLTEWQPDQFRERYPKHLYELARIWLDHNDEHRPDWLRVE